MNAANRRSLWVVAAAVICILLIGALIVSAQSSPPSIPVGENQTGSLTDASSSVQFSIAVPMPQNVTVQVLATSPGFAPAFRVLDPNNAVVFDAANPDTESIVQGSLTLSSFGTYLIEVRSANNTPGQFTLSVQAGTPLAAPTPLPLEQLITASVDMQTSRQAYSFTALSTDALLLDVTSSDPDTSPVIHLSNADTGSTLGLSNADLTAVRFRMPIGSTHYLLEVTDNGSAVPSPQTVTICLWPEHSPSPCPGVGGSVTVQQNPTVVVTQNNNNSNGACGCEVTASGSATINIHVFPSLLAATIGLLPPNTPAQVIGELPNHSWIKISYNGVIGWVSAAVVTLSGDCTLIPQIPLTPPPPGQPTATLPPPVINTPTPTAGLPRLPTRVPIPSATPTHNPLSGGGPTHTPTSQFHLQPSLVYNPPTATPTHIIIR